MRTKLILLIALIFVAGCSSSPSVSPTSVVKKYMAALESGDINGVMKLFSREAIMKLGEEKIRENCQGLSDTIRQVKAEGGNLKIEKIEESINGDQANVSVLYAAREKNEVANIGFTLLKEGGEWKVYKMVLIE